MGMLLKRRHTDEGVAEKTVAPSPSPQKKVESEPEHGYTEASINALNGVKLRKLAKANGVVDPEELTAGELKAILCEKLVK